MIPAVTATYTLRLGMAWLRGKLQQGGGRAPSGLRALSAAQTAGEIVHKGGRRMFHGCEVDVAWRLAARALNLQPGKAAVDGLVDRRRGVDRLPVGPHPFVPTLAEQPVRLLDECFALCPHLGRLRGQYVGHRTRLAELLLKGLSVTSGEGRRVVLRRHPDIQDSDNAHAHHCNYSNEGQQPSSSCRPVRCWHVSSNSRWPRSFQTVRGPAKPDRICLLYLDGAGAAAAGDAEHVPLDVAELLLLDRVAGRCLASAEASSRTACQYSGGISSAGPGVGVAGTFLPTTAVIFAICLGVGMRQLAGRSVMPD